jgi:hypothetical protein
LLTLSAAGRWTSSSSPEAVAVATAEGRLLSVHERDSFLLLLLDDFDAAAVVEEDDDEVVEGVAAMTNGGLACACKSVDIWLPRRQARNVCAIIKFKKSDKINSFV